MLLEQTLLKSLVLFCFSNFTVWWLEVKMPSAISRQCKDQRTIKESFLGSITFSNSGLMGPVLPKISWRCEVLPFYFCITVLYFSFPHEMFPFKIMTKYFVNQIKLNSTCLCSALNEIGMLISCSDVDQINSLKSNKKLEKV